MECKTLHGSKVLLRTRRYNVVRTPGKNPREIVIHHGAAVILPLLTRDKIVMIRNHRIAAGDLLWELPCGTLEPPESPLTTAARELKEETAYTARKLTKLCQYYSSPGICTEVMHAFLAEGLEKGDGQDLDSGEEVKVEIVPLKRALKMVEDNLIRDGEIHRDSAVLPRIRKGSGLMAWQDRDYNREDDSASTFGRWSGMSVVTWLIIVNTVLWAWDAVFAGSARASGLALAPYCAFDVEQAVHHLQLWRWVTYAVHPTPGFLHLFFNMLGLYFFGPIMEN